MPRRFSCPQYQVRVHHTDSGPHSLIYAPRDADSYVRALPAAELMPYPILVDRRLSLQRKLIRRLEESLGSASDERKQMMYEKLRQQHKEAMHRVIAHVSSCA